MNNILFSLTSADISRARKTRRRQSNNFISVQLIWLVAAIRLEKEIINYSVMSPREFFSLYWHVGFPTCLRWLICSVTTHPPDTFNWMSTCNRPITCQWLQPLFIIIWYVIILQKLIEYQIKSWYWKGYYLRNS